MAGLFNNTVAVNDQHSLRVYCVPGWILGTSRLFNVVLLLSPLGGQEAW